jgi:hypothetical protein
VFKAEETGWHTLGTIQHEEDLVRGSRELAGKGLAVLGQLSHQPGVVLQAPRGVADHHVYALSLGLQKN